MDYKKKYNMNTSNQIFKDIKNISYYEVKKHSPWVKDYNVSMMNKIKKEILSEKIANDFNIWNMFFSDKTARRVTNDNVQMTGIDYFIYSEADKRTVAVDIKAIFGDYRIKYDALGVELEGLPIELSQNGIPTFVEDKATDYVLYIYGNTNTLQVYFVLIPYKTILKIISECNKDRAFTTDNGSGLCVKINMQKILSDYGCAAFTGKYGSGFSSRYTWRNCVMEKIKR